MLDIKYIRENLEKVKESAELKHCEVDFDSALKLDEKRRELLKKVEEKKSFRNNANDEIARIKKVKGDFKKKIEEMKSVSEEIKGLDSQVGVIEKDLLSLLQNVPNVADQSVPRAGDASGNEVIKEWGEKPQHSFKAKDHVELGEALGFLDFKAATKLSGSGFSLYKGKGAKLERALINFMLDFHTKNHAYTEVSPPFLVNRDSMIGTGQIPKMEEDMYATKEDDLFLIPTAEVPVTNIHRNEILNEKELPLKYTAYTPCFRREAGSYGKDTRGLSRVHQFDKVELVKFTHPDKSYEEHEKLLTDAEVILQALGLPYRVVLLAAGDMSFAAAKCYDLEVWSAGCESWLEVSSCSNFEDFQARRAGIRFRDSESGKTRFVHTLNASALALPRTVIALLENYQNEDGSVRFPDVLKKYF